MNELDIVQIVQTLYAGTEDESTWEQAMLALMEPLGCEAIAIINRSPGAPGVRPVECWTSEASEIRSVLLESIDTIDMTHVFNELIPPAPWRTEPAPLWLSTVDTHRDGIKRSMGIFVLRVARQPHRCILLVSSRHGQSKSIFPVADLAAPLMSALLHAASMRQSPKSAQQIGWLGQQIIDRFDIPIMVFDSSVRLVHGNHAGRAWYDSHVHLFQPAEDSWGKCGRFERLSPNVLSFIAQAGASPGCAGASAIRLRLETEESADILLAIGVTDQCSLDGDAGSRLTLVIAHAGSHASLSWVSLIAPIFGLSGAEQRLLEQFVTTDSLDHAVETLGISKETGRSHLKSIFAKTGTKKQSTLIRMVTSIMRVH